MSEQEYNPYQAEGYEVLCTVLEQMEADILLEELNTNAIDAFQYPGSEETSLNFPPSETTGGIQILVKKEQLDEARELYKQIQNQSDEEA